MHDFPYAGHPTSWYQIGWSAEFEVAVAKPLRYFGTELVAYRGESGRLYLSDAFCLHLGAHLGYGGIVEGDCITCPFHGWTWGPSGENVAVPYSRPAKMKLQLRHWHVREVDGVVLAWYDAEHQPPAWEPPRFVAEGASLA
jgi:3-ketosteroid 9alpha-monooxygenase subunit A